MRYVYNAVCRSCEGRVAMLEPRLGKLGIEKIDMPVPLPCILMRERESMCERGLLRERMHSYEYYLFYADMFAHVPQS